jgi:hypothetical protein
MRYFAKTFRKGMSKITPLKQGQEQHLWKTAYQKFKERIDSTKPYAYKLIKKLNDELKQKGFITIVGHESIEITYRYAHLFPSNYDRQ